MPELVPRHDARAHVAVVHDRVEDAQRDERAGRVEDAQRADLEQRRGRVGRPTAAEAQDRLGGEQPAAVDHGAVVDAHRALGLLLLPVSAVRLTPVSGAFRAEGCKQCFSNYRC
jgi:hypothetical protein